MEGEGCTRGPRASASQPPARLRTGRADPLEPCEARSPLPRTRAVVSPDVNLTALEVMSSLSKGEGTRVEFKRRLPRDDRAARTLCAFANTRGGLLLVGVTDRGRVHGLHHPDEVERKIVDLAREWIEPALVVELQVVDVHGPRVVVCSVPFSKVRPHAVKLGDGNRQFLVRVGASNRVADGPTLAALRLSRLNRRGLSSLEVSILEWVRRHGHSQKIPGGTATVARFARLHALSEPRTRRLFVKLESLGLLVGHGAGRARIYTAP